MLIEFTVGNYRSIKEPVTLSMVAAKISSRPPQVDQNNTFSIDDDLTLLTSAAIYGANASGKSNLIKALSFMRSFVLYSSKETQAGDKIGTVPFRLSTETEQAASFFEVVFAINGVTYRYGFEVDQRQVRSEWLFYVPATKEARLFVREGQEFKISRRFKGGASKTFTRPNALFLSVAAQFNSETAVAVINWFQSLTIISGLDDDSYREVTAQNFAEDQQFAQQIIRILKESDVGIQNITIREPQPHTGGSSSFADFLRQADEEGRLNFDIVHTKWDRTGRPSSAEIFHLEDESEGTQKLIRIAGPVVDALNRGIVLVIDEIEGRLHTLLTQHLVRLFNTPGANPRHAQLIFATHDTNLLSKKLFRRDQVWFVEKDPQGSSHLYSLAELKVRNDASFESDYLEGRYGAIPLLGELRHIVLEEP